MDASEEGEPDVERGVLERLGRQSRRRKLLSGVVAALVVGGVLVVVLVPASLLGLVVSDTATVTARPAVPGEAALGETGHERAGRETVVVRQRVSPAGQERTVIVKSQRWRSERTVVVQNSTFTGCLFLTLASPTVTVAGQPRNPLATATHREILGRFSSETDALAVDGGFEKVGERRAAMLGDATTVSVFEANVTTDAGSREVAVFVTSVRDDGDVVVAVGVHPTAFAQYRVSVMRLIYSVQRPGG